MGWREVEDKLRRYIDIYGVSCHEPLERLLIRQFVLEEYPDLKSDVIETVIDSCCKGRTSPTSRMELLSCIKNKLDVKPVPE